MSESNRADSNENYWKLLPTQIYTHIYLPRVFCQIQRRIARIWSCDIKKSLASLGSTYPIYKYTYDRVNNAPVVREILAVPPFDFWKSARQAGSAGILTRDISSVRNRREKEELRNDTHHLTGGRILPDSRILSQLHGLVSQLLLQMRTGTSYDRYHHRWAHPAILPYIKMCTTSARAYFATRSRCHPRSRCRQLRNALPPFCACTREPPIISLSLFLLIRRIWRVRMSHLVALKVYRSVR